MDGIKHRKASSKRLLRAFQIANMQAANTVPIDGKTVAN